MATTYFGPVSSFYFYVIVNSFIDDLDLAFDVTPAVKVEF